MGGSGCDAVCSWVSEAPLTGPSAKPRTSDPQRSDSIPRHPAPRPADEQVHLASLGSSPRPPLGVPPGEREDDPGHPRFPTGPCSSQDPRRY